MLKIHRAKVKMTNPSVEKLLDLNPSLNMCTKIELKLTPTHEKVQLGKEG